MLFLTTGRIVNLADILDVHGNYSYRRFAVKIIGFSSTFRNSKEHYRFFPSTWDEQFASQLLEAYKVKISYQEKDGNQIFFSTDEEFARFIVVNTADLICKAEVKARYSRGDIGAILNVLASVASVASCLIAVMGGG